MSALLSCINLYQSISKCHLHSWKIILSCYVAVILEMNLK